MTPSLCLLFFFCLRPCCTFTALLFLSVGQWSSATEGLYYQRDIQFTRDDVSIMTMSFSTCHLVCPPSIPPQLKAPDIIMALEASGIVGVVQFLISEPLCGYAGSYRVASQSYSGHQQTGRDTRHLTRRGTSV